MGLGALLRNLQYEVTDTVTGAQQTFEVITDMGQAYPTWSGGGPYKGGMSLPGAWRAATLLSGKLGDIPWHAYRDGVDGAAERITPTPLLLRQPSPPDTRMTTFSSLALDLIWDGNAIAVRGPLDDDGVLSALIPVTAGPVGVRRAAPGEGTGFPAGTVLYDIGGRTFTSDEVVHIKGPCAPGALRGMGVLEAHLGGTLSLSADQDRQAGGLTGAGVPTGLLQSENPDLTSEEAAALKAAWMAAQRTRTVAVLNATTKFTPLAWNPTETQLLDARRFSLHALALIFGLDPSWLGAAQASMTYSNVEQEAINFVRYSAFSQHLARFEAALSAAMPPGHWVQANLDAMLRADTLGRYQAHSLGITSRFLAPSEARALENLPPLTAAQQAEFEALNPEPASVEPPTGTRAKHEGNAATLQHYWTKDPEGLAKWATSPRPFTALVAHLRKYVKNPEGLAATYYRIVFGQWPSDADE